MKKLILFLFLVPLYCVAQTNVTPQFKKNATLDSLGFSISGISGSTWLYNSAWVRAHYLKKSDSSLFVTPYALNHTKPTAVKNYVDSLNAAVYSNAHTYANTQTFNAGTAAIFEGTAYFNGGISRPGVTGNNLLYGGSLTPAPNVWYNGGALITGPTASAYVPGATAVLEGDGTQGVIFPRVSQTNRLAFNLVPGGYGADATYGIQMYQSDGSTPGQYVNLNGSWQRFLTTADPVGTGTVTAIGVTTANGVSGTSSGGTTPNLTIALGAITPTSTNGVSAATMAYMDATSSVQTQLNSKQSTITLTTTGTSGPSTLIGPTLNIPQYSGATGANPTAVAGTTAINGSATTFMRSDGAPAVDSTVFQTVANFFPKADTRYYTKTVADGKYALQTTAINNGLAISGGGNLSASRTLSVDTTVVKSKAGFVTDYNNLSGRITANYTAVGLKQAKIIPANPSAPSTTIVAGDSTNMALWKLQSQVTANIITSANPSATAGVSAVNGSASTYMRSDAAPKVDSTVFQTVLNFFPKADTRYYTKTIADGKYAPLISPALTGSPTAPTQTSGDNTTKIATDAFVQAVVSGASITFGTIFNGLGTSGSPIGINTDTSPTSSSSNLITSGGVYTALVAKVNYTDTATMLANYIPKNVNSTIPSVKTFNKPLNLATQTTSPGAPSGGILFYADSLNRLSWIKSDARRRTMRFTYAGNQVVTFENKANYTVADSADVAAEVTRATTAEGTKQGTITLTTTGTSGPSTFISNVLNVPQYAGTTYTNGYALNLTAGTFSLDTASSTAAVSKTRLATNLGGYQKTLTAATITWPGTVYTTPTTGVISGTTISFSPALSTQTANTLLSGPSSGSAATPTFRALVANDIPGTLNATTVSLTSLAATVTPGFTLINPTAATSSVQQNSPALTFTDQGWGTTAPASSSGIWNIYAVPTSGATPTHALKFQSVINGVTTDALSMVPSGASSVTISNATSIIINTTNFNSNGTLTTQGIGTGSIGSLGTNQGVSFGNFNNMTQSSGAAVAYSINTQDTQTGTAGLTFFRISPFFSSFGSGVNLLADIGYNSAANAGGTHTSLFSVDKTGIWRISATLPTTNQIPYYNGTTMAWGSIPLNQSSADLTAQTAAVSSVATYTASASNGTFRIGAYLNITAVTLDVIQVSVTYTDENNTAQTALFYGMGSTAAGLSAVGNSNFGAMDIRVKASTAITVKTVLTTGTGSITYDVGATISQLR